MAARVWAKFAWDRTLFIGVLDPTRKGDRVLQFLSSNRTQIWLHLEDIHSRVGYDTGTNSRPSQGNPIGLIGLAWTLGRLWLGVRLAVLAGLARLALSG
jgi:hypothetical protein